MTREEAKTYMESVAALFSLYEALEEGPDGVQLSNAYKDMAHHISDGHKLALALDLPITEEKVDHPEDRYLKDVIRREWTYKGHKFCDYKFIFNKTEEEA